MRGQSPAGRNRDDAQTLGRHLPASFTRPRAIDRDASPSPRGVAAQCSSRPLGRALGEAHHAFAVAVQRGHPSRSESNGSSAMRGSRASSTRLVEPGARAASRSATSVGSPIAWPCRLARGVVAQRHGAVAARHGCPSRAGRRRSRVSAAGAVGVQASTRIRFCVSVPVLSAQIT